jgi:hypothetical protein
MLTDVARQALDRHIERALRQRFGASGNLRHAVQRVVLELSDSGASSDDICSLLVRCVEDHPQRHRWDRVSIITGLSTSVVLTRQIIDWAEPMHRRRLCAALPPARADGRDR